MGMLPTGYDEELIKWFREGPTEYYAQLLTYRAGELSASNYVNSLNKDLLSFPTSTSEYVRGRVISLWLDGTIRRESGGQVFTRQCDVRHGSRRQPAVHSCSNSRNGRAVPVC